LVAKIIAYGDDRREAISRMSRALEEIVIEGISTNVPFQQRILRNHDFLKGNVFTNFLNRFK
jgi:acetyl-CoA carboxylase biotin carboxylase subunit